MFFSKNPFNFGTDDSPSEGGNDGNGDNTDGIDWDKITNSFDSGFLGLGDRISQGLEDVKISIVGGLIDLGTNLGNKLVDVKDSIVGGIVELGSNLGNKLVSILDSIINLPQNIIDLLKLALQEMFVPDETPIEDIKEIFNSKYPIINQIGDIAIGLFDEFSDTNTPPKFTVSINGNTYNIINLDWYASYKDIVKGILITLAWVYFVQWILKFLPRLLGGID